MLRHCHQLVATALMSKRLWDRSSAWAHAVHAIAMSHHTLQFRSREQVMLAHTVSIAQCHPYCGNAIMAAVALTAPMPGSPLCSVHPWTHRNTTHPLRHLLAYKMHYRHTCTALHPAKAAWCPMQRFCYVKPSQPHNQLHTHMSTRVCRRVCNVVTRNKQRKLYVYVTVHNSSKQSTVGCGTENCTLTPTTGASTMHAHSVLCTEGSHLLQCHGHLHTYTQFAARLS